MKIIKEIQDTFQNIENLTPDRIRSLIRNTLDFFKVLKEDMKSGDAAVREGALKKALELREVLQKNMENLSHLLYSNPDKLVALMQSMPPASEQDQEILQEIKKDLKDYQTQVFPAQEPQKLKRNAKRVKLAC